MFEINKTQFGLFLSAQRKEKGYTQKDLAAKLYISDKAVSKWERGISLPDISLLAPLAEMLNLSVTELLEGKKMDKDSEMNAAQVENLVKKALSFSEKPETKDPAKKRKHLLIFAACTAAVILEWLACFLFQNIYQALYYKECIFTMQILGLFFSAYFLLKAKEQLPHYYDENKISAYNDGFFELNLPQQLALHPAHRTHMVCTVSSCLSAGIPHLKLADSGIVENCGIFCPAGIHPWHVRSNVYRRA